MHSAPAPFVDLPPRVKRAILGLGAAVTIAGTVGTALLPSLSVRHPMVLLALAPNYLGLVAPRVDFTPAYLLVAARRLLGMWAIYGFGGLYGEGALKLIEGRSPRAHAAVAWVSSRFQRYGELFIALMPGVAVSLIAGVSGLSPRRFALSAALGQLIWTAVYFRFSIAIGAFSTRVLEFLEAHIVPASAVFLALVFAQWLLSRRSAKGGDAEPRAP
ncbi:MAG: hypothetical protein R3A48_16265 [Polyangiales bacterium]